MVLQNLPFHLKLLHVVLLRQMAKCKVKSAWVAPLLSEDGGRWVGGGPGRTTAGQSLRPNLHDDDHEEKKMMMMTRRRMIRMMMMMRRRIRMMMMMRMRMRRRIRMMCGWWSRQDNRCPVLATQFASWPLLNATLKPISHALTCFLLLLYTTFEL